MGRHVTVATFDAVGGPGKMEKAAGDTFWAGPTDAGVYVVARCGKHSSPSYPDWSTVRWGSEIKEEGGVIKVMHEGRWRLLNDVSPRMTKDALMKRNLELYGKYELPRQWLFNDFGHLTCYFFKDTNRNGKLDPSLGEKIHTEYFHTTPEDEAASAAGKPVTLAQSHGCIHLKPNDIDEMKAKGYFRPGNAVVVHKYSAHPPKWQKDPGGHGPFEVHFFPGLKKVIVVGVQPSRRPH